MKGVQLPILCNTIHFVRPVLLAGTMVNYYAVYMNYTQYFPFQRADKKQQINKMMPKRSQSDRSVHDESYPSSLLQQQKMYKVKMADLSMVCDGHHTNAINSKPIRLSLPSGFQGESPKQIVMHQPDWLNISSSTPIMSSSSSSIESQQTAHSPSDTVAKILAKSSNSTSKVSTCAPSREPAPVASSAETPFKKISRKKSVPRHRCDSLNRSLTSVLKPSNYTFPKLERRLSRSLPPNSGSGLSDDELDTVILDCKRLYKSMPGFGQLKGSFSSSEVDLDESTFDEHTLRKLDDAVLDESRVRKSLPDLDDSWVPKGVDFSLTVEAYFYRRH